MSIQIECSGGGDPVEVCNEALATRRNQPASWLNTSSRPKGLDTGDKVLAKAVAAQLIHSLRMQALRAKIARDGKNGMALISRLPEWALSIRAWPPFFTSRR
jgi:hypothetical protein